MKKKRRDCDVKTWCPAFGTFFLPLGPGEDLEISPGGAIPFRESGPTCNIKLQSETTIRVCKAGCYKVEIQLLPEGANAFGIEVCGVVPLQARFATIFAASTILCLPCNAELRVVNLDEDDELELENLTDNTANVAQLTLTKVSC